VRWRRLAALAAQAPSASASDEIDAWELARRVEASDVSTGTLDRIERAVDDLASAYARLRRPICCPWYAGTSVTRVASFRRGPPWRSGAA
jgi:hypothetical protein